jgi:anti-sigma-K factor RskA
MGQNVPRSVGVLPRQRQKHIDNQKDNILAQILRQEVVWVKQADAF